MRRLDNPIQQIQTVCCLHPTLFDTGLSQLLEDFLVDLGNLCNLCIGNGVAGINNIKIGRSRDTMTFGKNLLVVQHLQGAEVGPVVGELFHFTLQVGLIEVLCGVPNTYII